MLSNQVTIEFTSLVILGCLGAAFHDSFAQKSSEWSGESSTLVEFERDTICLGCKLKGVAYLEFLPGKFAAVQLLRSCNGAVIRIEIASRDIRTNVFGRARLVSFIYFEFVKSSTVFLSSGSVITSAEFAKMISLHCKRVCTETLVCFIV